MKQTLLEIQLAYGAGMEPTVAQLAEIVRRRFPADRDAQDRYFRQLGEFLGQAVSGLVINPEMWTPPD